MFLLKLQANQLDAKLKAILRRLDDLTPAMQEALDLTNESVLEEFEGSFYRDPSGGKHPWKAHVPFGTATRGRILWHRGRLKAAMTGGKGSASKVSARSFSYGIDPSMKFSQGGRTGQESASKVATLGTIVSIHRGGLGRVPNLEQVTVVKARPEPEGLTKIGQGLQSEDPRRWKMYWKLRRGFGLRFTTRKLRVDGFKIKARGFATATVPLKKSIAAAVKGYILANTKGRRKR